MGPVEPIEIRYSWFERGIFLSLAIAVPITIGLGLALVEDRPDTFDLIFMGVYELVFIWFAVMAFRFKVRVDEKGIFHREIVKRRIALEDVERVRIARETKGLVVNHTKVEIIGGGTRILVGWRSGKMAPLVEFLTTEFSDKIEEVKSLPSL
jgi:hypothetical protein